MLTFNGKPLSIDLIRLQSVVPQGLVVCRACLKPMWHEPSRRDATPRVPERL
jgi:hypothetical protein